MAGPNNPTGTPVERVPSEWGYDKAGEKNYLAVRDDGTTIRLIENQTGLPGLISLQFTDKEGRVFKAGEQLRGGDWNAAPKETSLDTPAGSVVGTPHWHYSETGPLGKIIDVLGNLRNSAADKTKMATRRQHDAADVEATASVQPTISMAKEAMQHGMITDAQIDKVAAAFHEMNRAVKQDLASLPPKPSGKKDGWTR